MELTRRGFLRGAAAAAASAALPACATPDRRLDGAIVGGADARGHLLRGGALPPVASTDHVPVVIVGGGMAGLSAAWRLRGAGHDGFLLLELEDSLGGTAASGSNAVSAYPWGAHYVPVPTASQRTLRRLLEEAGVLRPGPPDGPVVPVEEHLLRDPEERLFYRGAWSEGLYLADGASREDLRQRERFERETAALAARVGTDGRRAFTLPVEECSRDGDLLALDRISMADWMAARGFDSPRLRWYVEYATRDDFGTLLGGTAAWAGLHYFCSRVGADGAHAEFLTWPEGNGFLVRHLAAAAGARRRTGAVVTALEPADDRVVVRWVDTAAGVSRETTAERVVCAVPRFVARRLLPEPAGEGDGFRTSPWVVANLTLRSAPSSRGFPLCWDNVLYEGDSLGYVVATHQTDRLARDMVWTWYRPFPGPDAAAARAEILATPWEGWRDAVLRDLVRAHPDLERHVARIDVWRWGHAMVRPEPGFVWGDARVRAAEPRGRVHFAAADLGGLPLFEEAQWHGVRAAEEILSAEARPFESWL